MDFLKRHYEKIVLGVVLLGLVAAVALLYFKIESEKAMIAEQADINRPNPKELEAWDSSRGETVLKRVETKVALDLSPPHNVVNPVPWVRMPDGQIVKQEGGSSATGPSVVKVVRIDPLHLVLAYGGTNAAGYEIAIERQASPRISERGRTSRNVSLNNSRDSTTLFFLRNARLDAAGSPTELELEMLDGKRIKLNPPNPYREVAGYKATLRYPPENNREFRDCYRDSEITIEGERYIVLSLSESEVVLSAKSNGKKTTIHLESRSPAQ